MRLPGPLKRAGRGLPRGGGRFRRGEPAGRRRLRGPWKRAWRWLPWGREQFRDEIQAELAAHVAQLAEEDVARGVPPGEPRRAARPPIGDAPATRGRSRPGSATESADRCQDGRRVFRFEHLLSALRFGFRLLRRSPSFTLVAV